MSEVFDYIVVGGGSAGCVVARRLAEDPACQVLLLESGPPDNLEAIRTPHRYQETFLTDWAYQYYTEQESHLLDNVQAPTWGRRVFWPQGRTLGGSGSINAMIYIRGNRRDYDNWHRMGNEGWSYEEVLPLFRKSEDQQRGPCHFHGIRGPMTVTEIHPPSEAALAFLEAGKQCGYTINEDFNGEHQTGGVGLYQVTVSGGTRVSSASAFIAPFARSHTNLTVRTLAQARRILFEGRRARGVEYSLRLGSKSLPQMAYARDEVVVCSGSVGSPKLLLLSGLGPVEDLRKLGIPVVADLPGVGRNLQDHLVCVVGHRYTAGTSAPPSAAGFGEGGLFLRTRSGRENSSPDLQLILAPWLLVDPKTLSEPVHPQEGFGLICVALLPESRGSISVRSSLPEDPPIIRPNYLHVESDLQVLVEGIKKSRELLAAGAFDSYRGQEVAPGSGVKSDAQLRNYVRLTSSTLFHPAGTCKMGHDPMAVVDDQLRVHKVTGLRVADASIMPRITAGNTNAPTVMIGEKAAVLIRHGPQNVESRAQPERITALRKEAFDMASHPDPETTVPYTAHLLARLRQGQHWKIWSPPERQYLALEHLDYWRSLEQQGLIVMGGPLKGATEAYMVFAPERVDWKRAVELCKGDPWVQHDVVQFTVSQWNVVVGERLPAESSRSVGQSPPRGVRTTQSRDSSLAAAGDYRSL